MQQQETKSQRITSILVAALPFFANACTYSAAVNADLGAGSVDSDHYNLARGGAALGFGLLAVPASVDLRFSHEMDWAGTGLLAKHFQQNETMADLNVWWPNSVWQPMLHVGSFSNEFNGLTGASAGSIDYGKHEIGIGVRHHSALPTSGGCNIGYGYTVEAFASKGSGSRSAEGGGQRTIGSFGVRVSTFVDSGDYAGVLPWAGGISCNPSA